MGKRVDDSSFREASPRQLLMLRWERKYLGREGKENGAKMKILQQMENHVVKLSIVPTTKGFNWFQLQAYRILIKFPLRLGAFGGWNKEKARYKNGVNFMEE